MIRQLLTGAKVRFVYPSPGCKLCFGIGRVEVIAPWFKTGPCPSCFPGTHPTGIRDAA